MKQATTLKEYAEWINGGFPTDKVVLINEDGGPAVVAFFMDQEFDPFVVKFSVDDGSEDQEIVFHTNDMKWLTLSASFLETIVDLSEDAKQIWDSLDPYWSDDTGTWTGWEHLATKPNQS